MTTVLSAQSLSCERDYRLLFENLSFDIHQGEVWQVVGHNGVGKTSLIRGLCGMNSTVQGNWQWFGNAWPNCRYEFAARSLYFGHQLGIKAVLSPRENLRWFFDLRQEITDCDIEEALDKVGLAGYEDTPCYSLSAGQQRRVGLARLEISKADVWILDEPFTAIDLDGVAALEQRISDYANSGGTVILTSHHTLSRIPQLQQLDLEAYRAK